VTADGVGLFFDVDGEAPAVDGETMIERPKLVLLHGGPGADHTLFKPEFAALTDIAQIVYLDQRGSGRSDIGEPRSWTWNRWADDAARLGGSTASAVRRGGPGRTPGLGFAE
jgi:pimeloyl-ACP methyl ester carboxylesterase